MNVKYAHMSLFAIVLLGGTFAGEAKGCQCPGSSVRKSILGVDVVFAGEVVSMEGPRSTTIEVGDRTLTRRDVIYTFRVSHLWRGRAASNILVTSNYEPGSCGYRFNIGERYLVFAEDRDGELWTGACEGNLPYDYSAGSRYLLGVPAYMVEGAESAEVTREQLMEMLGSADWGDAFHAAMALREDAADRDDAIGHLVAIIRGRAEGLPAFALMALARMSPGHERARLEAKWALTSDDAELRETTYEVLHHAVQGDALVGLLREGFQDPEAVVRAAAIGEVRELNWVVPTPAQQQMLSELGALLGDPDARVRVAVTKTLWWIDDAAETLVPKLKERRDFDPDAGVRQFAGLAVRRIEKSLEARSGSSE